MTDFSVPALDFGGVAADLDFSLSDVTRGGESDGLETCRYDRPRVYDNVLGEVSYEHACDFVDGLDLSEGARSFAFVSGNFVFGDALEAMVERRKVAPRLMTVQTLSMSEENIDSLRNVVDMMDGRLERLRVILSVYFWGHEHRPGQLVPYLYEALDVPGLDLDVAFASIHTKIVSVETLAGHHLVMDGSANLRSSRNIEQLRVECDDGLYECVERFADRVFAAYSTINRDEPYPRPVRGNRLWGAITD
ncbi:MAG: hypothetical protein MR874_03540 [Coriobacteriaceae bacterium]|nr:hypothetical protein [Coriobacteriaceae bacterium]